jgi:hypothetical protein
VGQEHGVTLTVTNIGPISVGTKSAMPILFPGGSVVIVALDCARWEWDVERGDGKGEQRLKMGVAWSVDNRRRCLAIDAILGVSYLTGPEEAPLLRVFLENHR